MMVVLVQMVEGVMVRSTFDINDAEEAMEARGYTLTGQTKAGGLTRPELWNRPKFAGVLGPMWDGGMLRYEDDASYKALSE